MRDNFEDPVKILGSVTLVFEKVNPLRYEVEIKRASKEFAGADLSLVGLVPMPSGGSQESVESASAATAESAGDLARASEVASRTIARRPDQSEEAQGRTAEEEFRKSAKQFQDLKTNIDAELANAAATVKSKQAVLASVRELVQHSDDYLADDHTLEELVTTANGLGDQAGYALDRKVPASASLLREVANGLRTLANIPLRVPGFQVWYGETTNRDRYESLRRGYEGLAERLTPLGKNGALRTAADGLDAALSAWRPVLKHLQVGSFEVERPQRCDYPFFKRREYTFTLSQVDRLESDPTKALSSMPVARVVCLPVLVPSAGIAAGGVDERTFGFLQSANGAGGVKSTIGIESKSGKDISGLVLVNARFGSSGDQKGYGFYASAGTQIKLGDSLEGDRIGYVLGASVSFGRSFFLTLGVEAKRVRELTGEFSLGDDVPEGLTAPPTQQEWAFDGFLGVTVAIR